MGLISRRNIPTYVKYIFSYLLILTVLILGFYFIIRNQFTDRYFEQRAEHTKLQMDGIVRQFNDDLVFLSQVDNELINNKILRQSRYDNGMDSIQIYEELRKYEVSSKMISSIVYSSRVTGKVYSTELPVQYKEGLYYIHNFEQNQVVFDLEAYLGATTGQLIFLGESSQQYLIYLPATGVQASHLFFYVLNAGDIQLQLRTMVSEEILAVALIDGEGQIIEGANFSLLIPYLDHVNQPSGVYQLDSGRSLCVNNEVRGGYVLAALLSDDFLQEQIASAVASTYLALMFLGMLGLCLVFLAMRITYLPLRRLIAKIDPYLDVRAAYLPQLEHKFSEMTFENQQIQIKLDNYRSSIQKGLLDSLVASRQPGNSAIIPEIDRFFDTNSSGRIFVIIFSRPDERCEGDEIQSFLMEAISEDSTCILWDSSEDAFVYFVYYTGDAEDKERVVRECLYRLYYERHYMSALSKGADSPLDIPALYENALHASSKWPQIPVADSRMSEEDPYGYPYEKLDVLSELLWSNQFQKAKQLVEELLCLVKNSMKTEDNLQEFYAHNILLDLLMRIVTIINMSNISFQAYSDLYYETLYYCRSYAVSDKLREIVANIRNLMDIYEQNYAERTEKSAPYRQVVEECYSDPNFSIAVLAEQFHVSVSHMSNLFKKETNMNFSDYLWMQRLNKAKELLCTTDMSVDEVSVAVGYNSTSGFRRKFRQETGISPSQFRESCGKE